MKNYIRTYPLNFNELTESQKVNAIDQMGEDIRQTEYLPDPCDKNQVLPLCNFIASNSKLWDGIWGQSYFSGYFVKFGRDGAVTVGYRHW